MTQNTKNWRDISEKCYINYIAKCAGIVEELHAILKELIFKYRKLFGTKYASLTPEARKVVDRALKLHYINNTNDYFNDYLLSTELAYDCMQVYLRHITIKEELEDYIKLGEDWWVEYRKLNSEYHSYLLQADKNRKDLRFGQDLTLHLAAETAALTLS